MSDKDQILQLIVDKIDTLKQDLQRQIEEVQDNVDNVRDGMIEMTFDVRRNTDNLEVHMKRTELAELTIKENREEFNKRLVKIEDKLTINYLLKLFMAAIIGVGSISGSIYAVIKLIDRVL